MDEIEAAVEQLETQPSIDSDKLERLGRYEAHMYRKLEWTLALLMRLKYLHAQATEAVRQHRITLIGLSVMFAVDECKSLRRMRRRPSNWDTLIIRGWLFLPENRRWDAYERDAVISAIEDLWALHDILGDYSDAWLKRRAAEYCQFRTVTLTADPD